MNCKPGDLAYVVRGLNVGAIVEVIDFDEYWSEVDGEPNWFARSRTPLLAKNFWNQNHESTELCFPDSYLRPISGVPVSDDVDTEVPA